MAQIQVTLDSEQLKDLFASDDRMRLLLENVLNQVLDEEMTDRISAERYERTDERQTYRNGYRTRRLTTRVGTLVLRVPQTRDGSFSTELFRRYQRSEQALVLALMEMVLQGVSTRKVTKITDELCGTGFSKSSRRAPSAASARSSMSASRPGRNARSMGSATRS